MKIVRPSEGRERTWSVKFGCVQNCTLSLNPMIDLLGQAAAKLLVFFFFFDKFSISEI